MASRRLSDIAALLGLTLQGPDATVRGVSTLEHAGPDELSFLSNPKYTAQLATTRAAAVILHPDQAGGAPGAVLLSANPYEDFGRALALFAVPQGHFRGVSPLAFIHPEALLGEEVTAYPMAYVGPGARIGDGAVLYPGVYVGERAEVGPRTVLYPHVAIMADCAIGADGIVHPGAVIGADGFGFARTPNGIQKIPQAGRVRLGDRVEVGANTTIDRAVLDVTHIGDDTKIDNLVQLGHNVRVGRECFIVSQVGVSGSTTIGDGCTLAGQVGVAGHLHIGDNVTIGPQSGVARDVAPDQIVGGSPAVDQRTYMRTLTLMPRFPEIFKRLATIEKTLEALQGSSDRNPA